MTWSLIYEERLQQWSALRQSVCDDPDLENLLMTVNDWWWMAPMVDHTLTWTPGSWPDPWCLMTQSGFCDLARALGIVYTLLMIERSDIHDISIMDTGEHNLVHVNQEKYTLNWCPGTIVNIPLLQFKPRRSITSQSLKHLLG